jgi:Uma2 family endonuclease
MVYLEGIAMPLLKEDIEDYTTDYIEALPEGERAELIDGVIYDMASPMRIHQKLVSVFTTALNNYIKNKGGDCEVYPAPFAVYLNKDNKNYVEPDISVICDLDKLDERGCNGAPDFIIEITSPSTKGLDYGIKLFKYRGSGVREYWIVNSDSRTVSVYDFEHIDDEDNLSNSYSFDDEITSCIYPELTVRLADYV